MDFRNKYKISAAIAILFFSFLLISACSHFDELENSPKESKANGRSHNSGKNCGSCHNSNGNEASSLWWTAAGTVYNTNGFFLNNVSMELWDGKNRTGNLIKKITSDNNGNFYTNQIINFKSGLYPVLVYGNTVKPMQSEFNGGSCSSCHNGIQQSILKIN